MGSTAKPGKEDHAPGSYIKAGAIYQVMAHFINLVARSSVNCFCTAVKELHQQFNTERRLLK
jgi:hypothetical protein